MTLCSSSAAAGLTLTWLYLQNYRVVPLHRLMIQPNYFFEIMHFSNSLLTQIPRLFFAAAVCVCKIVWNWQEFRLWVSSIHFWTGWWHCETLFPGISQRSGTFP